MTKIDPEQERQRLMARYAAMSDLELKKVGGDPASLTEWAKTALQLEMQQRGMEWRPDLRAAKPIGENDILNRPVILRRYRDLPRALVEKSVLEDAGIASYFQDDNVIRMDWLWSNGMGGIKLLVREGDVAEAERILNEAQSARQEGEDEPQS